MKIGNISRLLSAFATSTPEIEEIKTEKSAQLEAAVPVQQTDAVQVSRDFGYIPQRASDETREQKVARLRDEVQSGTYSPDLREVAKAVINDLFA